MNPDDKTSTTEYVVLGIMLALVFLVLLVIFLFPKFKKSIGSMRLA